MYILSEDFAGYMDQLAAGAWITIQLFLASFALAFAFGVLIGIASLSRNIVVQVVWKVYASAMMGVPSLLVIFLAYYGGAPILQSVLGVGSFEVTPFAAGVFSLTIVYAAYIAELIQGAVRNLDRGQFEAAHSLGIKPLPMWMLVILPQVFRLALPGLVNIWMIVLKDTPLVSLAGLNDLVAISKIAAGATQQPFVFFIVAAAFFIVFSWATLRLSAILEARLGRGIAKVNS
jgi:His/Glu/Gln/Arg/opine family amino acid ABC transporter permease subunit